MSDFAGLLSARGHGLVLPRSDEDQINRYVGMHSAERGSVEQRPFGRQVDFWALSIAAALAMELEPREGPAGTFPGCESFHLPASEVADRMHSDGLRAEHCAGGRYGPRPAMKPGVDWQDRLHGIEMFQKYPNGPVGRSWKAACNSCQSLFEPIEPCVVIFEGGSGLQADDENQPDVVLVRNPRANARNRVRNRVRQQRVSTCLRYNARDFQGK